MEALVKDPEVMALVQSAVDETNSTLSRFETIKKFAILPRQLTLDEGELTASMKVKRRVVEKNFQSVLDGFYEGALSQLEA